MKIISIDGLDNIGKTTQLNLLHQIPEKNFSCSILAEITKYTRSWPLLSHEKMREWRFSSCPSKEFFDLIFRSYKARFKSALQSKKDFVFYDRGMHMLVATCNATARIREDLSEALITQATLKIEKRMKKVGEEDFTFFLLYSYNINESINYSLSRENFPSEKYTLYQKYLCDKLFLQIKSNAYDYVLSCKGKSKYQIHREIMKVILA